MTFAELASTDLSNPETKKLFEAAILAAEQRGDLSKIGNKLASNYISVNMTSQLIKTLKRQHFSEQFL